MNQIDKEGVTDDEISTVESIVTGCISGRIREPFSDVFTGTGRCEEDNHCEE